MLLIKTIFSFLLLPHDGEQLVTIASLPPSSSPNDSLPLFQTWLRYYFHFFYSSGASFSYISLLELWTWLMYKWIAVSFNSSEPWGKRKFAFSVQIKSPRYISFPNFPCVTRVKFHNNDKDERRCDLIRKTSSLSNKNTIRGIPPIIHLNELTLIYMVRDIHIGTRQLCSLKTSCSHWCQIIHFLCLAKWLFTTVSQTAICVPFVIFYILTYEVISVISPLVKLLPLAHTSLCASIFPWTFLGFVFSVHCSISMQLFQEME